MVTPKKPKEVEIKGEVLFKKVDRLASYFELEQDEKYLANRTFTLDRSVVPDDYEPEKYEVTGEYSIKIKVTEK